MYAHRDTSSRTGGVTTEVTVIDLSPVPSKTLVGDGTATQSAEVMSITDASREEEAYEDVYVTTVNVCQSISLPVAVTETTGGEGAAVSASGESDVGQELVQGSGEKLLVGQEVAKDGAEFNPSATGEKKQEKRESEHPEHERLDSQQLELKEAGPQNKNLENENQDPTAGGAGKLGAASGSSEHAVDSPTPVPGRHADFSIYEDPPSPPNANAIQSVPPHLRPGLQGLPRPYGPQAAQHVPLYQNMQFSDGIHGAQDPFQPYQNHYNQGSKRRDDITRTQAALTKAKQDLATERLINKTMRAKEEANAEAAFHTMLKELLRKQILVAKQFAELHKRANNLKHREHLVQQLESFLAIGQQQIYLAREIQERDVCTIAPAEINLARRQGEAEAVHRQRSAELQLANWQEQLNFRETNLAMREEAYKVQVRDALEAELRAKLEPEIEARFAVRIAEAEHRGFHAGKAAGLAESQEEVTGDSFVEGYNAGRHTMDALQKFRAGKIPHDSPELYFLNPDNPRNLFQMGVQTGRLGAATTQKKEYHLSSSFNVNTTSTTQSGHAGVVNGNITLSDEESPKSHGNPFLKADLPKTNGSAIIGPKANGATLPSISIPSKSNSCTNGTNGVNGISKIDNHPGEDSCNSPRLVRHDESNEATITIKRKNMREDVKVHIQDKQAGDLIDLS